MTDIEKAKNLLCGDGTCALVKGEKQYVSRQAGISPMIDFLDKNVDLKGFSVADKIVGKAAAMLFSLAGIKEVFATVMSKSALKFLKEQNIRASFGTVVENIINRAGTGICPMEETVLNLQSPQDAYCALKEKLLALRSKK